MPENDPLDLVTNEIAVASNMSNHKNFLKLLGCCLENEVPILVYEFPENGNLSDHIFLGNRQPLVWESRLRIVTEVANAFAYLHKGTAKVIIHRDTKSSNIFLDQDYVAKLFEFRKSVAIPFGEDHVNPSEVVGTVGYIAPESYSISPLTEKSDVYSFGFVLSDILTGKRVSDWLITLLSRKNSGDELQSDCCHLNEVDEDDEYILINKSVYERRIESYLKTNILAGNKGQVIKCAELILRCLKKNPEERPAMMEVAQTLRSIKRLQDL